jgi:hypothetical protein
VTVSVASNSSQDSRANTATIGGQIFTVNQTGLSCTFSLSPASSSQSYSGGTGSLTVTTGSTCAWAVTEGPSWVSFSPTSGTGTRTVNFTVAANSSTQSRSGASLIGGQSFYIEQTGVPCTFSVSGDNPLLSAGGGAATLSIQAAGPACDWIASRNVDWLTLSPSTGTGSGTLTYTAPANPAGASRTATITVAGQNIVVTQAGTTCTYALRAPSAVISWAGGDESIGVIAPSACAWSAATNATWLTIKSGATGAGSGTVYYTADWNTSGVERSGTLTIDGLTFSVTQPVAPCTYTLTPSSSNIGPAGGAGSFTYTSSVTGCAATVTSYAGWAKVTSTTFNGATGTVNFLVDPNISLYQRTGSIMVGDLAFTVIQAAPSCAYTLASTGASFGYQGGTGNAVFDASPPGECTPAINATPPLLLGPLTVVGPTFTQSYTVPSYLVFVRWVRIMPIDISGQTYTVKQNSWEP